MQLIYISTPVEEITGATAQFIPKAKKVNDSLAITGMILSDPHAYIQVLEGEKEKVDNLFAKISADPRHTDVRMIRYVELTEREFPKWGMRHVRVGDLSKLSDHDAIKLLYKTNDKELSKSVTRLIASTVSGVIAAVLAISIGGPLVEAHFAPALTSVNGIIVEEDKIRSVVLVTAVRARSSCIMENLLISGETRVGNLQAHIALLEISPASNERFVARVAVSPPSGQFQVEIRSRCQPFWSQTQELILGRSTK